jgi:hypothetical protein
MTVFVCFVHMGDVDNGIKRAGMPKAYLRYIMIILSV